MNPTLMLMHASTLAHHHGEPLVMVAIVVIFGYAILRLVRSGR